MDNAVICISDSDSETEASRPPTQPSRPPPGAAQPRRQQADAPPQARVNPGASPQVQPQPPPPPQPQPQPQPQPPRRRHFHENVYENHVYVPGALRDRMYRIDCCHTNMRMCHSLNILICCIYSRTCRHPRCTTKTQN